MITGHAALGREHEVPPSQATTIPFGFGMNRPAGQGLEAEGSKATQQQNIEVDEEGESTCEPEVPLTANGNPPSPPAGGIGDSPLDELAPPQATPVPSRRGKDQSLKSRDSMEELIPGPPGITPVPPAAVGPSPVGHHVSALESLLVRKSEKDSSGSETSRKPPPSKIPSIDAPGFGGMRRGTPGGSTEFFDLDPPVKRELADDELREAGLAAPVLPPRVRKERERERPSPYEQDTPPWVGALEGRLLAHLEPIKTDVSGMNVRHIDMHRELVHFTSELGNHKVRLDTHDAVLKEHTEKYEAHQIRLSALEREVRDLRAGSRSPTPARAPPSPRGNSPRSERNIEEELQLALGGWEDARREEAVEEAKALFEALQLEHAWLDIWSPYSRTSHVRIALKFPETHTSISQQRRFQKQVLEKLQTRKFLRNIPGQECREIWVQRHRTPEERAKIRAIVSVKEFIEQLTFAEGHKKRPGEINWRGKLFVGNVNILGSPEQTEPLQEDDFPLSDARGNHSGWFIRGAAFHKATGLESSSIPHRWETRITRRP